MISRRQLEAFGETLGECVTRLEGGRIVYGGGSSSSAPSTTTQINDLPDWSKPTAERTLNKAEGLSNQPYQKYTLDRIAGFSPLELSAQNDAAGMKTSRLGENAGRLAGAATLGALGTSYDPYQTGQFNSQAASQYMNPFVEQAMAPQIREAQRASDILGTQQAGQAVQQGAFGGSRAGLVEAERQRNLATQQGDIRARGYQAAYDRAQDQFGREQQLREQSRQFGSSLGLQGLQTALQGAGQMSNIGNQQFNQGMDINRLQQQTGALQRDLRQKGLSMDYQDFLDEKNHPYKQLGFMSDMIRGLPLGSQSTSQVYQAPGSLMGQLGGIGMGMYGMSKMVGAEGGQVREYADGGSVTSDDNIGSILSDLSDAQLQQARKSAIQNQDKHRLEMIDDELAKRASLRSGMGSAFNALPQEMQDSMTQMANGGIVAFADEGLVSDPMGSGASEINEAASAPDGRTFFEWLSNEPQWKADLRREKESKARPAAAPKQEPPSQLPPAPEAKKSAGAGSKDISRKNAVEAVQTMANAAKIDLPKDNTIELANTLFKERMKLSEPERAEFKAELESAKNRAKQIQERGVAEALMKFGFSMAASAAKPGVARRSGLAGALESAAAASPVLAESMAENSKLQEAAQDNYMKLRMENARYQSALEQGNMQLAATMANNISQRQLTQAQLQDQIAQHERMYGLEKEKLGIMRSQASQPTSIQKIASDLQAADPSLDRRAALNEASRISGYSFKTEQSNELKRAEAMEKLRKANPMYGVLEMQLAQAKTPADRAEIQQKLNIIEARATGKMSGGAGSGGASQEYNFDSKGNPI